MKNFRIITAKYNPGSNSITLKELRYKKVDTFKISFDYGLNNTYENAIAYLKSKGIIITGYGSNPDNLSYTLFTDQWSDNKGFLNIKGIYEL